MRKIKSLTPAVLRIIKEKGTEPPFSCREGLIDRSGSYLCRGCGAVLFRSQAKFESGCGWPSFDDELSGAIARKLDQDGFRVEITCAACDAHLGHVFEGEGFTDKNTRHCVNACAIEFVPDAGVLKVGEAIVAGGCFWGIQYLFSQLPGVLLTEVGYTSGLTEHPTYEQVCSHDTGHVEAVRVIFDLNKISYDAILKYFFEIHDFTQQDGQGPDVGSQYLSRVFYFDAAQKVIANQIVAQLEAMGFKVATQVVPVAVFWSAEKYHQYYYQKNKKEPYCHYHTKIF